MRRIVAFILALSIATAPAYGAVIPSIPYNLTNGSLADASQVMGNFNTIVSDVNSNAAHSGANSDITSLVGLTTALALTYGGTPVYVGGTSGGSANAQTFVTVSPTNFALVQGSIVTGIAVASNTGAMTLAVAGGSALAVDKAGTSGPTALTGGEIKIGNPYLFYYDGTRYNVINPTFALASTVVNGPGSSTSGDIVTFNGTGGNVIQDSGILPTALVKTVKAQVFTSGGTYTPCTGLLYNVTEVLAGGGGGGAGSGGQNQSSGGGGGGYAKKVLSAATVGASQTITIGAAGATATNGGTGGTGGTSSIGAIISCSGGIGGVNGAFAVGGVGGTCTGGDFNTPGQNGSFAFNAASEFSGNGASSIYGAGGAALAGGAGAGGSAAGYGAGGGGSFGNNTSGAGAPGLVYITEYCNQ